MATKSQLWDIIKKSNCDVQPNQKATKKELEAFIKDNNIVLVVDSSPSDSSGSEHGQKDQQEKPKTQKKKKKKKKKTVKPEPVDDYKLEEKIIPAPKDFIEHEECSKLQKKEKQQKKKTNKDILNDCNDKLDKICERLGI